MGNWTDLRHRIHREQLSIFTVERSRHRREAHHAEAEHRRQRWGDGEQHHQRPEALADGAETPVAGHVRGDEGANGAEFHGQ